jgi:hypothetical protein
MLASRSVLQRILQQNEVKFDENEYSGRGGV